MPPASYLKAGNKPEGGRVEFSWLIFERDYRGPTTVGWLLRSPNGDGRD
jgi:hypothetical protein